MINRTSSFFERVSLSGTPASTTGSSVLCGNARFTVLTDRLVRMEWSEGAFEDRATFAFPSRYADLPEFTYTIQGTDLKIETKYLSIRYVDNGQPFDAQNLSIICSFSEQSVKWVPGSAPLGNLRGTRRTLDECAAAASLQEGLISRDGWSLFDDSGSPVWSSEQRWIDERPDAHKQDWYFFGYGHDYKAALCDYIQFGGPIPLVPRYVLGLWWSRFWAYHADDLIQLVADFDKHEIPLDVLVVDMDWHTPYAWTGYTWNRDLFPDPETFLSRLHAQNLAVTLNLHPAQGVQKHEAMYQEFAERMGQNPMLGEPVKFDSTSEPFIQNYFELLHYPMEAQGVDFWWLDWQQGESSSIRNLDPLLWLNHLHFRDSARRGKRPMLYSRWGGLGNHRYPIGFSGDTYATWDSLRFQPYFTATAANVAYGWWSHDIGGHFGATEPELYARWVQFGAVSPCLRLHSTKDPLAERRPWAFPDDVFQAVKAAITFRYRLFPYLYSAARTASQQGLSLCYPMYYEYPEVEDAYLARGQYFLGDQLFVAPIVSPTDPATGLASINVWIPDGTWVEFSTLEVFRGPRWVQINGDLNRIPMFVKAGGIVPSAPLAMRTQQIAADHLIVTLFPGAEGHFSLYEDDGTTAEYQNGEFETTALRSTMLDEQTLAIAIDSAVGKCTGLPQRRTLELHIEAIARPQTICVNDAECSNWTYDATQRELVVLLNDIDRRSAQDIVIQVKALDARSAESAEPLVHIIDYDTFDDARQQLGTVIVEPSTNGTPFTVEVQWQLERNALTSASQVILENCQSRQILHCPFKDDGSLASFRWNAHVTVRWADQIIHKRYQSQTAYPSITHWQAAIYTPDESSTPEVPDRAGWHSMIQSLPGMPNIRQPFGMLLLQQERERLSAGESLEACLNTMLVSDISQAATLCVQCVGEATCFLNGVPLEPASAISHEKLGPMFSSWMQPAVTYFALSLHAGSNQLTVVTQPKPGSDWWGVGATLFDSSGLVLTQPNDMPVEMTG